MSNHEIDEFLTTHGWSKAPSQSDDHSGAESDEWTRDVSYLGLKERYILRDIVGGPLELEVREIPDPGDSDAYAFQTWADAKASPQISSTCTCEPRCVGISRQQTEHEVAREIGLI
jgi:hypothetical protein